MLQDLLPILALTALSLLLLYLIAIATTTTAAAVRQRRSGSIDDSNDNDLIDDDNFESDIGILFIDTLYILNGAWLNLRPYAHSMDNGS